MTEIVANADRIRIAAIVYRAADDVDALIAEFALARLSAGDRLGGIVQRNIKDAAGRKVDMQLIDLTTGATIGISQTLGSGAGSCKLDAGGLVESAHAVRRATEAGVDLVVINKFSKQEATGHGLRAEFAEAILAGRPLLTAVPEKCLAAWRDFIGGDAAVLPCSREAVEAWWAGVAPRMVSRLLGEAARPAAGNDGDRDGSTTTIG